MGRAYPPGNFIDENGKDESLFLKELDVEAFNGIAFEHTPGDGRVKAKICYRQAEQWATVTPIGSQCILFLTNHNVPLPKVRPLFYTMAIW